MKIAFFLILILTFSTHISGELDIGVSNGDKFTQRLIDHFKFDGNTNSSSYIIRDTENYKAIIMDPGDAIDIEVGTYNSDEERINLKIVKEDTIVNFVNNPTIMGSFIIVTDWESWKLYIDRVNSFQFRNMQIIENDTSFGIYEVGQKDESEYENFNTYENTVQNYTWILDYDKKTGISNYGLLETSTLTTRYVDGAVVDESYELSYEEWLTVEIIEFQSNAGFLNSPLNYLVLFCNFMILSKTRRKPSKNVV